MAAGRSEGEVLALAAAAEAATRHPLADAVMAEAAARGIAAGPMAESATTEPGAGGWV